MILVDGAEDGNDVILVTCAGSEGAGSLADVTKIGDGVSALEFDSHTGPLAAYNGRKFRYSRVYLKSPSAAKVDPAHEGFKNLLMQPMAASCKFWQQQHDTFEAEFEAGKKEGQRFQKREIGLPNKLALLALVDDAGVETPIGDLAAFRAYSVGGMVNPVKMPVKRGPSSPFRASVCAARTLNATGQSRVTLSFAAVGALKSSLWAMPGEKEPNIRLTRFHRRVPLAGADARAPADAHHAELRGHRARRGDRRAPVVRGGAGVRGAVGALAAAAPQRGRAGRAGAGQEDLGGAQGHGGRVLGAGHQLGLPVGRGARGGRHARAALRQALRDGAHGLLRVPGRRDGTGGAEEDGQVRADRPVAAPRRPGTGITTCHCACRAGTARRPLLSYRDHHMPLCLPSRDSKAAPGYRTGITTVVSSLTFSFLLSQALVVDSIASNNVPMGTRYDDQVAVLGKDFQARAAQQARFASRSVRRALLNATGPCRVARPLW